MKQREHHEQVSLVMWANAQSGLYPELRLLMAIPNGGDRHPAVAAKMRAEGVKRGVPDLFFPVPIVMYDNTLSHGLWIEMKSPDQLKKNGDLKAGAIGPWQAWWHEQLKEQGYEVAICATFEDARDVLLDYVKRARM